MLKTPLRIASVAVAIALTIASVSSQQQAPLPERPMPAVLKNYQPVTAERLKNPDARDWLMIRRTYDGWGYRPLEQITPGNVSRLKPVWVFSTAEARVHQAAPIVNVGVMFVTSPNNQVSSRPRRGPVSRLRRPSPRPHNGSAASD